MKRMLRSVPEIEAVDAVLAQCNWYAFLDSHYETTEHCQRFAWFAGSLFALHTDVMQQYIDIRCELLVLRHFATVSLR